MAIPIQRPKRTRRSKQQRVPFSIHRSTTSSHTFIPPLSTKQINNHERNTTHRNNLFKVLLMLIIIVVTINIKYLPSTHLPDSNEDNRPLQEVTVEELIRDKAKPAGDNEPAENNGETGNNEDTGDKERVIDILERAGVMLNPKDIANLPTWSSVVAQYGSEPVIVGLDTCKQFQSSVPEEQAWLAPA
eukprot:5848989-Ditylum_brightwellii.AAC.1